MAKKGLMIIDIRPIAYEGDVYNLHIEDNHNYFANGINVSNCHAFKSKSLSTIMNNSKNTPYRVGLTGTLDDVDVHERIIEGLFGPIHQLTTTSELIDKNILSNLSIDIKLLNYNNEERRLVSEFDYNDEKAYIVGHNLRNQYILNLVKSIPGNVLVLYQWVEDHGNIFLKTLEEEIKDRPIHYISGQVKAEVREQIRKVIDEQPNLNHILLASYGTFSTGVNIRNINSIVFASPYKSKIKVLQSIGRGLRKSDQKDNVKIYDVADNLKHKERNNYTLNHLLKRVEIYNKEKFNYNIQQIELHNKG